MNDFFSDDHYLKKEEIDFKQFFLKMDYFFQEGFTLVSFYEDKNCGYIVKEMETFYYAGESIDFLLTGYKFDVSQYKDPSIMAQVMRYNSISERNFKDFNGF